MALQKIGVKDIHKYFMQSFEKTLKARASNERRIGLELKFPLVRSDGTAVGTQDVNALWKYLSEHDWETVPDSVTGSIIGAKKAGEQNDTVASCETGFCKAEFSLAHSADLLGIQKQVEELKDILSGFSRSRNVYFLGYGIQPVSPPCKALLMKKARTGVWDKVFPSNRFIPEHDGDDFHLFTINAASHVHVDVCSGEAIRAVNILNGFAGPQIALSAHSNIWKGRIDPDYKCVAEKFWDWWMPDSSRVGIPPKPFRDIHDYVETISALKPVFVKRFGKPIVLKDYKSFAEYYAKGRVEGFDFDGKKISFVPMEQDIDLHNTAYWYNARISHYFTVENRVNDQQPPGELLCIAALTLGLLSAADEAAEEIVSRNWGDLRDLREAACRYGLSDNASQEQLAELSGRMLDIAEAGLLRRGLGEEVFLEPLKKRLQAKMCPADEAAEVFRHAGIEGLVNSRKIRGINDDR